VLSQTPSAFASLQAVDAQAATRLAVRLVVFGGEPLDTTTLSTWHDRYPRCVLLNMFGITETTVHVTAHEVTTRDVLRGSRSVGRPLPGWSVSVRDPHGRPVPFGVTGEIYVGGAGLALGYLNNAALTAARFIADEHSGELVYRSGDSGRLHPDGRLDHLGRLDDQVQVRGHRIELGEIRSVLLEDASVTSAAVTISSGMDGDPAFTRIDAYVVLNGAGSTTAVRSRAARLLPEYMLPHTITAIEAMPLTVNGKVDLSRLPAPVRTKDASPDPVTGIDDRTAATMLDIWRGVFGLDVTIDDDFFELGGNSLIAVRLLAASGRAGVAPASLRDLYLRPTIAKLASV
jgi:acyl-coenzyme A synthetase/AMP-(fatty) acid ligase